jgi:hypothetical protein
MTNNLIYLSDFLKLQDEVNSAISPEGERWCMPGNEPPAKFAIIDEMGEFVRSIGYEWWKQSETDYENAIMELADMLAFAITSTGVKFYEFQLQNEVDNYSLYDEPEYTEESLESLTKQVTVQALTIESVGDLANLFELTKVLASKLAEDLNVDYLSPFTTLIAKNYLNIFRTNNGYKEGTYKKIWAEKEDNYYLQAFISGMSTDEVIEKREEIFNNLQLAYDNAQ